MDLALTKFSGRPAPPRDGPYFMQEAYSREVISSGFWFGDAESGNPAFYSYTAPEPGGLAGQPLRPEEASWLESGSGHLAVLPYDAARADADPVAAVLDFFESAYQAGARLAGWDVAHLACAGGITDPVLRSATSKAT
jgi:hypothetical protein